MERNQNIKPSSLSSKSQKAQNTLTPKPLQDPASIYLTQELTQFSQANFLQEKLCLNLEDIIYNRLDNYRDETEFKYKKLRDKQLSLEQEKKLEEEINKKLSGLDKILNKALSINPSIFGEENSLINSQITSTSSSVNSNIQNVQNQGINPQSKQVDKSKSIKPKKEILKKSSKQQQPLPSKASDKSISQTIIEEQKLLQEDNNKPLDLFRIYKNDSDIKTKNQAFNQIRDLKKDCRTQLKTLLEKEDTLKNKTQRGLNKLGMLARQVRSQNSEKIQVFQQKQQENEIIEINMICKGMLDHQKFLSQAEKITKSAIFDRQVKKLQSSQDLKQQFYDYYALWIMNKKLSEVLNGVQNTKKFVLQQYPMQKDLLSNTFIVGQTISLDKPQKTSESIFVQLNPKLAIENEIMEQCEEQLLELYKDLLKQHKSTVSQGEFNIDLQMHKILNNKYLVGQQKLIRNVLQNLDVYEDSQVKNQIIQKCIDKLQISSQSPNNEQITIDDMKAIIRAIGVKKLNSQSNHNQISKGREGQVSQQSNCKLAFNLIIYQ